MLQNLNIGNKFSNNDIELFANFIKTNKTLQIINLQSRNFIYILILFYILCFSKKGNQINDIGKCLIVEALNENNNIQNIDFGCEFWFLFFQNNRIK